MTSPVWSKRVGDEGVQALNVSYCAGRDVHPRPPADAALVTYDLQTNAAHVIMLGEQGIISDADCAALLRALLELRGRHQSGQDVLLPDAEDVHMSIEVHAGALAGREASGRMHTGRSRNDQVATDMRLWLRDGIVGLAEGLDELARVVLDRAAEGVEVPCPGMTHMQPAMPTTWGHWLLGYMPRLRRDLRRLRALLVELEECPLGSAASFGTSWPVNRERTAELLGFVRPTSHTTDPIWSRGETEAQFAFVAAQTLAHLSGMGQDLILLSSPPREWVRLSDAFVTGSSIMPQKRNPDFAEVTRAKAAAAAGYAQALLNIGIAAPAGYNRDSQWTKYLVMDVEHEVHDAPRVFAGAFASLTVNAEAMRAACEVGFLNATDVADFLARTRRLPFRECYRILGRTVQASEERGTINFEVLNAELDSGSVRPLDPEEVATLSDPVGLLHARRQTGSPSPQETSEAIEELRIDTGELMASISHEQSRWRGAISKLWSLARSSAES